LLRVLRHDLPGPVRIAAPALHDLDEAGLVRVTLQVGGDVVAVGEADLPGEQLGRLRPPLALLRPLAVAPGGVGRLEPGQPDELAVVGHPGGRPKPARRPRRQLLLPALERGVDLLRVADLATDHLNKHDDSPNSLALPLGPPQVHATTASPPASIHDAAAAGQDCAKPGGYGNAASSAPLQSRYPAWLGWKQSAANLPGHGGRKCADTSATGRPRAAAVRWMTRLIRAT